MSLTELDVDAIVKSVLRQLQAGGEAATTQQEAQREVQKSGSEVESRPGAVRVSGRVVTADLLAHQAVAGAEVILDPRALITPSARDYLKSHQIRLSTAVDSTAQGAGRIDTVKRTERWLGLRVDTCPAFEGAWKSVASQQELTCEWRAETSTEDAAGTARSELNRGGADRVLVLTDRVATAACLANRHERVRALAVQQALDLNGLEELRPNVVCLSSKGLGFSDYLRLLREILKYRSGCSQE